LLKNIYGSSINDTCKLKFLLEGLECYNDRYSSENVISKLAAKL